MGKTEVAEAKEDCRDEVFSSIVTDILESEEENCSRCTLSLVGNKTINSFAASLKRNSDSFSDKGRHVVNLPREGVQGLAPGVQSLGDGINNKTGES